MSFSGFSVREVPVPGIDIIEYFKNKSNIVDANKRSPKLNLKAWSRLLMRAAEYINILFKRVQHRYGIINGIRMPEPMAFWGNSAYRTVSKEKWDLVVSTAGPFYVHFPAFRLRRSGSAKCWIADWRDLWVDNHMFPGIPLFRSIERRRERIWCQTADIVTTVSEPLAEILRNNHRCRVEVIYNGYDVEDYKNLPAKNAFNDSSVFKILYTGTIYQGSQDPVPLFDAVKSLEDTGLLTQDKLSILFCGNNADVMQLANKAGVSGYVKYLGFIPRQKALQMQRDANALLLLEVESIKAKGILTGKIFEYMYAGPPIIAIGVGMDSSVGEVLKITGRGIALGRDIDDISDTLMKLLSGRDLMLDNNDGQIQIMRYSREVQANSLIRLAQELLSQ